MFDKSKLLDLLVQARKRADQGTLDISAQNGIISELERMGIDATKAKAILASLIAAQDIDMTEMERILDQMDAMPARSS